MNSLSLFHLIDETVKREQNVSFDDAFWTRMGEEFKETGPACKGCFELIVAAELPTNKRERLHVLQGRLYENEYTAWKTKHQKEYKEYKARHKAEKKCKHKDNVD